MTEERIRAVDGFTGSPVEITLGGGVVKSRVSVEGAQDLPWIAPGFLDAQVNGLQRLDYTAPGLTGDMAAAIASGLLPSGTTRHVATIVTAPADRIVNNLSTLAAACDEKNALSWAIPAFHVEGPFIAPDEGPRGAHDVESVRDPDVGELREWYSASRGRLRLITLAPERPGAIRFIEEAVDLGVTVAIGHTAADHADILRAVDAGAGLSTHLGNGSHALLPRLQNYLWVQLAEDRLSAGMIADGFHLPDSVIRVFSRAKGLERIMLVSDVAPGAGLAPGPYRWGNIDIRVHTDGHLSLGSTEYLAGAGHLLDRCVAVFTRATGVGVPEVIPLVTRNPARILGLPDPALVPGQPADLVVFRWSGPGKPPQIERVLSPAL
jgi:N-acetylglucosamine-6-phosphate deacetylase